MIRAAFEAELTALPRSSQLPFEVIHEGWLRDLEQARARGREPIGREPERQVVGRFSNGERYTILSLLLDDGQRVEVTAVGAALGLAVTLEPGDRFGVRAELLGDRPHYRLRISRRDSLRLPSALERARDPLAGVDPYLFERDGS